MGVNGRTVVCLYQHEPWSMYSPVHSTVGYTKPAAAGFDFLCTWNGHNVDRTSTLHVHTPILTFFLLFLITKIEIIWLKVIQGFFQDQIQNSYFYSLYFSIIVRFKSLRFSCISIVAYRTCAQTVYIFWHLITYHFFNEARTALPNNLLNTPISDHMQIIVLLNHKQIVSFSHWQLNWKI